MKKYRIVETKDQEGNLWYHAEEAYDADNWHLVKGITESQSLGQVEQRIRNHAHFRVVKEVRVADLGKFFGGDN